MTFSGTEIKACPHCNQLLKNRIIISYNTYGSVPFSDGHLGGVIINTTSIIKCAYNNCTQLFNVKDAKIIGEISEKENPDLIPHEWKTALPLYTNTINITDLQVSLTTDFVNNKNNEINVRTLLLRLYNDKLREDRNTSLSIDEKEFFAKNIAQLLELLNDEKTPSGKIFLAELHREIGNFDLCTNILTSITDGNETEKTIKEKIYSQAKVKDDRVFKIQDVVIKKEYKCNNCSKNLILFDLEKIYKPLEFKHYKCKNENTIFSAPSMLSNPNKSYELNFLQKALKFKAPYQRFIKKDDINCIKCNSTNTILFNPITNKCIHCLEGNYNIVKWF